MIGQFSDNQIKRYLMGLTTADETETLDELSFIDDDFAARMEGVENDLIDAYVQGELSGSELKRFEEYYLTTPLRIERVEFAKALNSFALQNIATESVEEVPVVEPEIQWSRPQPEEKSQSFWKSLLSIFTIPKLSLQVGFAAATMMMLIAGGWMLWQTMQMRGQIGANEAERAALQQREKELQNKVDQEQNKNIQTESELKQVRERLDKLEKQPAPAPQIAKNQPRPVAPMMPAPGKNDEVHFLSPQTRSLGNKTQLVIRSGAAQVPFRIELESNDYVTYQAELISSETDSAVWESNPLKAVTSKEQFFIDLKIPAKNINSADYKLRLKGITSAGETETIRDYALQIVKQ